MISWSISSSVPRSGMRADRSPYVTRDRQAERGRLNVKHLHVLARRLDGRQNWRHWHLRELLFHSRPKRIEVVRHRETGLYLGWIDRSPTQSSDWHHSGLLVCAVVDLHLNEPGFRKLTAHHSRAIYQFHPSLLIGG